MDGSTSAYVGACRKDIPYPSVSHESVPSLIDNLVSALYGSITKTVVNRRVQWNIPCDTNNTAKINNIPRNAGEGLLCYIIRALNLTGGSGIVTVDGTQTLTNKTLTAPVINNAPILSAGSTAARTLENRFADVVNVKDFGAVGDGVTDDTIALRAARTFAETNGTSLYWPDGNYFTTGDIDRIHTIRSFGDGAITRAGGYRFWVEPKNNQTNTLYVSPSGQDQNDAIDPANPFQTVQKAFDSLKNYGPTLNGTWVIQLAAGTYNAAAQLVGLRSLNNIIIRGPSVGGSPNVPTAIIDGTNVTSNPVGWYFQFYVKVSIYDIKFQNWTSNAGDAYGLVADGHCELYLNNGHFFNNRYAALTCDNLTQAYIQGGIIDGSNQSGQMYSASGFRCYSQASVSLGYSGTNAGDSTEIKNCFVGVSGRVSSRIHIDYCNIHNNSEGIRVEYNTRCVVNYTKLQNNSVGGISTLSSEYNVSYDGSNIVSGNTQDYICYSSILSATTANECNYSNYWDEATKRKLYGASAYRTPDTKFNWQCDSASSNSSIFSATKANFDFNSSTNYLGLSSPSTAFTGVCWSAPSKPYQAIIGYNLSGDYMDFWTSAAQQYRMQSTQFVPLVDNTRTLGNGSFRWSTVYAGTGTINTSDEREKQQIEFIDPAVLTAWKKVNFKQFKFNDAVEKKGDKARLHFGVIAQQVKEAFESEKLDAFEYGLLCYDEWEETPEEKDEEGNIRTAYRPAGNRYGVRYEEALALECAYQRIVTESLLQRIEALESR